MDPMSLPCSLNPKSRLSKRSVTYTHSQTHLTPGTLSVPGDEQAFQMIDQDKDGFISKNDIRQTFDSLGTDARLHRLTLDANHY